MQDIDRWFLNVTYSRLSFWILVTQVLSCIGMFVFFSSDVLFTVALFITVALGGTVFWFDELWNWLEKKAEG
jgi:hypothetical protein